MKLTFHGLKPTFRIMKYKYHTMKYSIVRPLKLFVPKT